MTRWVSDAIYPVCQQNTLLQSDLDTWRDCCSPVNLKWYPSGQVAIVLFRTLEEFYDAPLKFITLPLIIWRFVTIGIGSLLTGETLPS